MLCLPLMEILELAFYNNKLQLLILNQSLGKKEVVKELNTMNLKKEKELYDRDTFLSMKEDMVNYKEIEKLGVGDSFCKKFM